MFPRVRWAVSEPGVGPAVYVTFEDGVEHKLSVQEALRLANLLCANLEQMVRAALRSWGHVGGGS